MRLAVMQPYFFPYLGYFSLIAATDRFVVFDAVQYIRHGWINRNRILKPDFANPQYINVPLAKHSRDTVIRNIRIADDPKWKDRILGQVQHYKKRAPFFRETEALLKRCLSIETDNIVALNVRCIEFVCRELEIVFDFTNFAQIATQIEPVHDAGEWALNIATAMGATSYTNPSGGQELFDKEKFASRGVELEFIQNNLQEYSQRSQQFVAGLSILDVLMFNGMEETHKLVNDYRIVGA